jgi:hypothetical protein
MRRRVLGWLVCGLMGAAGSLPAVVLAQAAPPTAVVADSAHGGGRNGGTFFYLAGVNGQKTEGNTLAASRGASYGQGQNMRLKPFERAVPAGWVKLKLVGQMAFAAPVQEMFAGSKTDPLENEVEVELAPGGRYVVNGVIDAFRRELWLEDANGPIAATKLVDAVRDPAVLKQMADAQYTCCNLHYEGDWISDANWATLPFVPAGARIVVKDYGRHKAEVLIDGKPMRIGLDYGRDKETREQLAARLMVKDDPQAKLATWPAPVQAAILAGKVAVGMDREQVVMTLGRPRMDTTPSLDAAQWTYYTFEEEAFAVVWGADQRVARIDASPAVRKLLVAE